MHHAARHSTATEGVVIQTTATKKAYCTAYSHRRNQLLGCMLLFPAPQPRMNMCSAAGVPNMA